MHCTDWTADDNALLIQLRKFDRASVPVIAPMLDRTVEAVYAQCRKLGLLVMARRVWNEDDVVRLRALFASGLSDAKLAAALDRSIGSVRWKLEDLDLHRPEAAGRWNDADVATAERMLGEGAALADIGLAVKRSTSSVKTKLSLLGHVFASDAWTDEQEARLVSGVAAEEDTETIAKAIGRSADAVRARLNKMGLRVTEKGSKWTEADKLTLKTAIEEGGEAALSAASAKLRRSVRATRIQAVSMGLIEKRGPRILDEPAKVRLRQAASTMSVTACAIEFGHDVRTLKQLAEKEGFSFAVGRAPAKPKPPKEPRAPKPVVAAAPKPKAERKPRVDHPVAARMPAAQRPAVSVKVAAVAVPKTASPPTAPRVLPTAPVKKPASREISRLADRFLAWREGVR
ncbi:hypothetical protein ACVIGB_000926 [Bradyrhizobium sp. USDA 4341]